MTTCPESNTWGLTLDDGPNCSHNAFFDYLLEAEQKASLFYVGSNVADWPREAQRGLADGHEICGHSELARLGAWRGGQSAWSGRSAELLARASSCPPSQAGATAT